MKLGGLGFYKDLFNYNCVNQIPISWTVSSSPYAIVFTVRINELGANSVKARVINLSSDLNFHN